MEKGSVVWTLTSRRSGEGKCCVDTNIREESVGSGEGKCCVDTNIRE